MDEKLLKKAKKKVKQRKGFYIHSIVIAAVSIFLFIAVYLDSPNDYYEVFIPISAMFLSVVIHYVSVFGFGSMNSNWEADALEEEYLKLKELEDRKAELLDEDRLRLKQLEKRYRDEDFV